MRNLWIGTEIQQGLLLLFLEGELTIVTNQQLLEKFQKSLPSISRGVVVEARRLTFLDSSGLGTLIGMQRDVRNKGMRMSFAGFGGAPKKVLEMTHMGLVMDLHDSLDKAKAAIP